MRIGPWVYILYAFRRTPCADRRRASGPSRRRAPGLISHSTLASIRRPASYVAR